ncbi:DUF1642 domain-containing protein [Lactococcus lactis]|uniref:DUF1642 domain-containing protein n=1 Tax=Lactococcus lactis TaxID=1358 RepID=UPI0014560166|nr:DUF1642 domain-containing protein [Lactococcus lactis]MCT0439727.1 DUF1642 domain-containing protein [Lactococcus lactis subsp. lactis]NLS48096.1 DUF1642 domain-containing protein [Lactococcus lactis]
MTKFEEEVNKYNIFERTVYLEGGPKKILIDHFKNWHSDEEFQAEKDARKKEYEIHQDIYSKTSKKLNEAELEIANLKSQLQQQALPVVPECVAEFIESYKDRRTIYGVFDKISKNRKTYPKLYEWVFEDENSQATFALAFITGKYEVEKPQLFKLIFPNSTAVLQKDGELNSFADTVYKRYLIGNAMTEQEIKSIDERYWQFAVPVEDGALAEIGGDDDRE